MSTHHGSRLTIAVGSSPSGSSPSIADVGPGHPWRIDAPPLLTTGPAHPLLPHLEQDLATASRVDIAVAFVMPSGVERLYAHFDDLLRRGGSLRLLTGDYLGVTDPEALQLA